MASILLMNTSFHNRGDALMNRAIQQRLGPAHRWSLAANVAFVSRREARPFDVALVSGLPGHSRKQRLFNTLVSAGATLAGAFPRAVRRRSGIVVPSEIDVALDVSGYCFGDPWGQERVDQSARNYRLLRQAGARVILMPKTWGPFKRIESRSLDSMFDQIDLAFARDQRSLALIEAEIGPRNREKLFFAPDYTHEVAPAAAGEPAGERIAYLIPSSRVIDSGTLSRDRYLALFADAREQLAAAGLSPKLLIHETANDMAFVDSAARMGFGRDEVVIAADAIHAKTLISTASAVVTSRLHGLYNALNCAVPVAVVAWSFKYEEALKQYHCEDCLVDISDPEPSLQRIVGLITAGDARQALQERMRRGKSELQIHTEAMWEQIQKSAGLKSSRPR